MFGPKVKLSRDLHDRAKAHAQAAGFGSVDEFVERLVEKELERHASDADDETVRKRLEGLGYI